MSYVSTRNIDGQCASWVAVLTREFAEDLQSKLPPEQRGGVEQDTCPPGTSWTALYGFEPPVREGP